MKYSKGIGDSHPLHGQNYAREMEFLLNKSKVEIVEMGKRTVKGANGESLEVIKLRILGSG